MAGKKGSTLTSESMRKENRWKSIGSGALLAGGVFLLLGLATLPALAADDLGTTAERVLGNLPNVLKLGSATIFVIGFLLVGVGSFMIWRIGRHQGMHGPATLWTCFAAAIAGSLMVYHSTVVGVGGATIFGGSDNSVTVEGTTEVR